SKIEECPTRKQGKRRPHQGKEQHQGGPRLRFVIRAQQVRENTHNSKSCQCGVAENRQNQMTYHSHEKSARTPPDHLNGGIGHCCPPGGKHKDIEYKGVFLVIYKNHRRKPDSVGKADQDEKPLKDQQPNEASRQSVIIAFVHIQTCVKGSQPTIPGSRSPGRTGKPWSLSPGRIWHVAGALVTRLSVPRYSILSFRQEHKSFGTYLGEVL